MELVIGKNTGTYAETLVTVGTASLLTELGFGLVTMHDDGACFRIRTSCDPPQAEWPEHISPGYPYIWESSKEPEEPAFSHLDYEAERLKRDAIRKIGKKAKSKLDDQDIDVGPQPVPEFGTAAIIASMRKGWNSDRDLAKWLAGNPATVSRWIAGTFGLSDINPNELPSISNTQILNPIAGKGVNAPKTEARSAGSIPGQLIDPFAEWMKMRGLWDAMLLYRSDDDFKFFVIEPGEISSAGLREVRTEMAALNLWGGVRLDINATLQCLRILVARSDAMQSASLIPLRRRSPRKIVRGLRQSWFKSLGTAAALMNDAMLPLPDWFTVENVGDAELYIEIIDETAGKGGCLNSLQEGNSDDGRVLQVFREWLLTGELGDLLEFHHLFAPHLMRRFVAGDWARPFGTDNFTKLLTKAFQEKHLTEIIEDPGFQSVARAVRNATIYALTIPNQRREVRFGLAQKWKQKIKSGDDTFTATLAAFVQEYNWETANRLKGVGHMVTTAELDSLMALVDKRHADIVGSLLLAYGFARAPRVESGQPDVEISPVV